MEMMLRHQSSATTFLSSPVRLHEVLLSTYADNWRTYLANIAESFNEESDMVFTEDLQKDSYAKNFAYLQQWRDLSDRAEQLPAHFNATNRILKVLQEIQDPAMSHFLERQVDLFSSIDDSASVLQSRIQGVIGLLSNTIDTKNQEDSANLNQHLYKMTRFSVDDSASVKLITIVTLFYLPASFVATLLGMNLFVFNQNTKKVVIAKDFWIYVVIFSPLTLLTFGTWKVMSRRAQKARAKADSGLSIF
jgi:Mg2+ and Co2+ transporter CorA